MPLPERAHALEQVLEWNLQVWGDRIPGYDAAGWRAFYERSMAAQYDRFEPGAELVWVIEVDAAIVGSIALVGEDDLPDFLDRTPWLAAFVVDPTIRHQGLGREVVAIFEQWCRDHQVERLYLWTDFYADWYRKLGYQEIATTRLADIDAVVMVKDLRERP